MDIKELAEKLHLLERKVLPYLAEYHSLKDLIEKTKLQEVEVMRALQWLENKDVIKIKKQLREVIELDKNGKLYLKKGLPERRFLMALKDKELSLDAVKKLAELDNNELGVCLGILKNKAAIEMRQSLVFLTEQGKKLVDKEMFEEVFLKKLSSHAVNLAELKPEERFAFENLLKRKDIVKKVLLKLRSAELTELGKKLTKIKISMDVIDTLTSAMLRTGSWKKKNFRRYDIEINVPDVWAGRKQHYRRFLDEVRQKLIALGFEEMFGPVIETDFWNMDALFMPQFHSARDIHQGYYIKEPAYSKDLPKNIVEKVKKAHENGFGTGSKGWQYKFDVKRTSRHVLRTHDTPISARILSSKELKVPGKYFNIASCFRYDVIDATHLADFYQTGGFVIDYDLNLKHLFGLLKMFAEEFTETDQIKIKSSYFPFTEPSAELSVKHPDLGWIELAGSGIFRPEMLKPLGVDLPVIAWGVGLDRLAMFKLGIKDIRKLFSHDLEFLREVRY